MGFLMHLILQQTLKYKSIIKMKKDLMVFIIEIIFLKKMKDGAYVINLDEYVDVGTHRIALFCSRNEVAYFDSFGIEHIPKEIKNFIENKNIKTNIFRVQANDSVMCGYFCIGFIDFMLAGKTLVDFTNMFSPYDFEKNVDLILSCFKGE